MAYYDTSLAKTKQKTQKRGALLGMMIVVCIEVCMARHLLFILVCPKNIVHQMQYCKPNPCCNVPFGQKRLSSVKPSWTATNASPKSLLMSFLLGIIITYSTRKLPKCLVLFNEYNKINCYYIKLGINKVRHILFSLVLNINPML